MFKFCWYSFNIFNIKFCLYIIQAAFKALKGAVYARDVNKMSDDMVGLAKKLTDSTACSLAEQLQQLLQNTTRMLYPNDHTGQAIPHDVYTLEMVEMAEHLATAIFNLCIADFEPVY